jgi:enediyne biosynthesis protein E4
MPTHSYLSQSELPVTFGLGKHDRVDRVTVRWPDGTVQHLHDVTVDRGYEITQSESDPAASVTMRQ